MLFINTSRQKFNLLLFLLLTSTVSYTKILIFTYAYNRPDFIELQDNTFKAFLENEYEFVIFNDARDPKHFKNIINTCKKRGLRCVNIPQEIHNRPYLQRWPGEDYNHPSIRNCNVVQYSLDVMGFAHDDILFLLDSDMFLVKKLNIREFLTGYDMGGIACIAGIARGANYQKNINDIQYLWHGAAFLDMSTMPNKKTLNFNCGKVEGKSIDAGGHSHYYLKNNPQVKVRYVNANLISELQCSSCKKNKSFTCTHNTHALIQAGFDEHQIRFIQKAPTDIEFFHDNAFLHYRAGSNWDYLSTAFHNKKTATLNAYLNVICAQ